MPTNTPNLNLIKPLVSEKYTVAVANANNDILDTAVNGKQPTLVSGTNIKTVNGASILTNGDLELLPKNNPTATGVVTLPNTTSIGNVSAAEIAFLDGVTSAIQTQLGLKANALNPILTGIIGLGGMATLQRHFSSASGTGIFESASVFGANIPTMGFLFALEPEVNKTYFGLMFKSSDASAVQHFVISNSGLSVFATNAEGTVAMTGHTNSANVIMKSFIIRMT